VPIEKVAGCADSPELWVEGFCKSKTPGLCEGYVFLFRKLILRICLVGCKLSKHKGM
jgi:hypothetical protein